MGKKRRVEDVIGKQFNHLFVIEVSENKGPHNRTLLKCRCDACGETKEIQFGRIGFIDTCGCQDYQSLTGQKIGMLQIGEEIRLEDGDIAYKCMCDCGKETVVRRQNLRNGGTVSCGHKRQEYLDNCFEDLTGQQFGELHVDSYAGKTEYGRTSWNCTCSCGTHIVVASSSLKSKLTKSCGCVISWLEKQCHNWLSENDYLYEPQYTYNDLYRFEGHPLKFDIALKDLDGNVLCLIECQGKQHYQELKSSIKDFGKEQREITDKIKKEYCAEHNIKLFEIRYDDNVIEKLKQIIKEVHANPVPSLYNEEG